MNKKGQGAIVAMSIGAILLVVILAVIFSFVSNVTDIPSVTNETITFSSVTVDIGNETVIMSGSDAGATGNTANDQLTIVTEIRNNTAEVVNSQCNVTISTKKCM